MCSAPATLEVAKAADLYGCLPGHAVEIVDGERAYAQAEMQGTPTWNVSRRIRDRIGGRRVSRT